MIEVVHMIIALGVLLVVGLVAFGIGVGVGRSSAKTWIKKNCCYTCSEKWRYSGGGLIDNADGDDD